MDAQKLGNPFVDRVKSWTPPNQTAMGSTIFGYPTQMGLDMSDPFLFQQSQQQQMMSNPQFMQYMMSLQGTLPDVAGSRG